jgi:uncharacterized protein
METVSLPAIPSPLTWENPPLEWQAEAGRLSITSGRQTDLFTDPRGASVVNNSPRLLFEPTGDFTLSASVTVHFQDTFDAGVLLLYAGERSWAKLCFEFSPQQQPMIVSVVTKGLSDDCNSALIAGNQVYLRLARLGRALAFHYSQDGRTWHMVRHFSLDEPEPLRAGFSAQAPRGDSCTAVFEDISFTRKTLADIRSGE